MTARAGKVPRDQPAARLIGWVLAALVASELLHLYSGLYSAALAAQILVLTLPVIGWRAIKLREVYLLAVCIVLIAVSFYLDKPVLEHTIEGLSRSAYLASFVLLMALLREGALTSRSVVAVGTFMTVQPANRRFVTLFSGSHFFAVLINLGSLSLLAPIIQRGVRSALPDGEPLDDISEVRERRQLTAALRGFSWFLVWAPTAVTQAVMPTLMSGIDTVRLIVTGLGLALVMLCVSWLEDAVRWRGFRKKLVAEGRLPLASDVKFPLRSAGRLGLVCLALFGLSLTLTMLFEVNIVTGVMLTSPIVVVIWIAVQMRNEAGTRLREITFTAMPGYFREAVFLGFAGFIGTMAAKLILAGNVAAAVGLADQPGWLVLWTLTILVWVFGQVGLSPITMAVFLGSVVAELPNLPVDITLAALAIAAGTAICTTGAPFASGALLLARVTGYSSLTLTWRWNGIYTFMSMAVLAVVYMVLTKF